MKTKYFTIAVVAILSMASCKGDKNEKNVDTQRQETLRKGAGASDAMMEKETVISKKVSLKLTPKSNSNASGSVVFKEENGLVKMTAVIGGLAKGSHAIHIHEKADCSSEDGKSSGGHWNPTSQPHGKWGDAGGFHKGDIGNFEVDSNGNGTISKSTDEWCIGCGDATKDILGKAIIVHQGTDDFASQPSGAAGARVSCGGIIK